jgi:hypothetical protein
VKPYIQDDWKVSSKLTLIFGFRYEFQTNPNEQHNVLHNLVIPPYGVTYSLVPNAFATNPNLKTDSPGSKS